MTKAQKEKFESAMDLFVKRAKGYARQVEGEFTCSDAERAEMWEVWDGWVAEMKASLVPNGRRK